MEYFVKQGSIVREIWGKADTVLFIFTGASAEFALNKSVDWLFFTGRLPADPLGRLFSTVSYARHIVFSENEAALKTIDRITQIHEGVETARGAKIPDWAYRDVLYMLIHYSISSFEVLERKLTYAEKEAVYDVFYRVGDRMKIPDLPLYYKDWLISREEHMQQDLEKTKYSIELYKQYKKHLGPVRFKILKEGQVLVVPVRVNKLLGLGNTSLLKPVIGLYKITRKIKLDWMLKSLIFPKKYKDQIKDLDVLPT
ncbi:MAG: hypothetical protein JWQ96_2361 [Segetibacter sp.]|nr:hypothetical protein [Segetibacter sp.]